MIGRLKNGTIFFSVRYKDAYGNEKQKYKQNAKWKTKKEAKEAMDLFLKHESVDHSGLTVDDLYQAYIHNKEDKLKLKTLYTLDNVYKIHIQPYFGKVAISDINTKRIVKWQQELLNKGYRNRYLENIQDRLKAIFRFGVEYDFIEKNPFKIGTLRNKSEVKQEMTFWTNDEFEKYIHCVDDPLYYAVFMTLYFTGIREGEMAALLIKDVDFDKGTISISKTYDSVHKVVTSPKTSSSFRTVYLTKNLIEVLKDHIESYKEFYGYDEDKILFGYDRYIPPTTLKRKHVEAIKQAEVKFIRIHDFRHSHVSLLINLGVSYMEIAKRLGHSVSMVQDVYGHLFESAQIELVRKLDRIEFEPKSKVFKA